MLSDKTQPQYLAFLASFATATGRADGHIHLLMGQRAANTGVRSMLSRKSASPTQAQITEALGAFYALDVKRHASALGSECAESARKTFGDLVNELASAYEDFCQDYESSNSEGQRHAALMLAGMGMTQKCESATAKITSLVNKHLGAIASDADRLFHYCLGQLAIYKQIRVSFDPQFCPPELNGIRFKNDVVQEAISRFELRGLRASGHGYTDLYEVEFTYVSVSVPYEVVEDSRYGVMLYCKP